MAKGKLKKKVFITTEKPSTKGKKKRKTESKTRAKKGKA